MSIVKLKITLMEVEPEVERVLLVPCSISLDALHYFIQESMGWWNSHLHMFSSGDLTWGKLYPDWETDCLPSREITIEEFVTRFRRRSLEYLYDFGDSWKHTIKIGRKRKPVEGELYPQLIGVTGRCPPEDVGGAHGYDNFLDIVADPDHEEYEETIEWCGCVFDPHKPPILELKAAVRRLAIWWAEHGYADIPDYLFEE